MLPIKLLILGSLLGLSSVTPALAQQDDFLPVTGRVVDSVEGTPAAGIGVYNDSLSRGTYTDDQGRFQLHLPRGEWMLQVQGINYDLSPTPVRVREGMDSVLIRAVPKDMETEEVDIFYKNPAIRIMENAIEHKDRNRNGDLETFQHETYNKASLSVNNLREEDLDNFLLGPLEEYVKKHRNDSAIMDTADGRYKMMIFLSEAVTQVYRKAPDKEKEVIKASQIVGLKNHKSNFLSSVTTQTSIYDNYIDILGDKLTSPLANGAFMSYNFAKVGEIVTGPFDTTFVIELRPKSRFSPSFTGRVWIENGDWAVKHADLYMNEKANLNFVDDLHVEQEFEYIEGRWLPTKKDIKIDFIDNEAKDKKKDKKKKAAADSAQRSPTEAQQDTSRMDSTLMNAFSDPEEEEKAPIFSRLSFLGNIGFIARSVTTYNKYDLNPDYPDNFFNGELLRLEHDATDKDSAYWAEHRDTAFTEEELVAKGVIDQAKEMSVFAVYSRLGEILTTNGIRFGDWYVGPIDKIIGGNQLEGATTRIGGFTSLDFNPRWRLAGWLQYGFKDERLKHSATVQYKPRINPMIRLSFRRRDAVEQAGDPYYNLFGTGTIYDLLRRVPNNFLNYYEENKFWAEADLWHGGRGTFQFRTKRFESAFPMGFQQGLENGGPPRTITDYDITEVGLKMRISFDEPYILSRGERIFMDTPFPQFYLEGFVGLDNFLGSDFSYQHARLTLTDHVDLGRFGSLDYTGTLGKIWGEVPFPSLYVFRGSQSFATSTMGFNMAAQSSMLSTWNRTSLYDPVSFNLMYWYEFIADEYAVFGTDWHTRGYLWRKLPLLRRLEWEEIFTLRMGWGSLSDKNAARNEIFDPESNNPFQIKAPERTPYTEVGVGVENIFKFFRIDYIWRLSYKDPFIPESLDGFRYDQGIRFFASFHF